MRHVNVRVAEIPDPADVALDRLALRTLLAKTMPEMRYILGRISQGATYREIADELQWGVGAVTLPVHRLRERVLRDQQAAFEQWNAASGQREDARGRLARGILDCLLERETGFDD